MNRSVKFSTEGRERSVRMVHVCRCGHPSLRAAGGRDRPEDRLRAADPADLSPTAQALRKSVHARPISLGAR